MLRESHNRDVVSVSSLKTSQWVALSMSSTHTLTNDRSSSLGLVVDDIASSDSISW